MLSEPRSIRRVAEMKEAKRQQGYNSQKVNAERFLVGKDLFPRQALRDQTRSACLELYWIRDEVRTRSEQVALDEAGDRGLTMISAVPHER